MKPPHLHTHECFRELWCMSGDLGNGDLFIDFLNKSKPILVILLKKLQIVIFF